MNSINKLNRLLNVFSKREAILPELSDFLIQQNDIQTALLDLILYKAKITDEKFIAYMETRYTLGTLISLFRKYNTIKQLRDDLEKYREARNQIMHRLGISFWRNNGLVQIPSQSEIREVIKVGDKILSKLRELRYRKT